MDNPAQLIEVLATVLDSGAEILKIPSPSESQMSEFVEIHGGLAVRTVDVLTRNILASSAPLSDDARIALAGTKRAAQDLGLTLELAGEDGGNLAAVFSAVGEAWKAAHARYHHRLLDEADRLLAGPKPAIPHTNSRKPGRPRQSDPAEDKRLYDRWVAMRDAGQITTYAEGAREIGVHEYILRTAYERHRKRLSRR